MLWNKTSHTDCGVYLYYINANILCLISELAVGKANDFNSDKDILVLPLDTTKFETHEDAFKTILDHCSQVLYKQCLFFHHSAQNNAVKFFKMLFKFTQLAEEVFFHKEMIFNR